MITGFFDPFRPPHPYVPASVGNVLGSPRGVVVPFLLDTGASRTILQPGDATRAMGISWASVRERMTSFTRIDGFAGSTEAGALRATMWFQDNAGPPIAVDVDFVVPLDARAVRGLPSILGWDVLSSFRMELDRRTRVVSLEARDL